MAASAGRFIMDGTIRSCSAAAIRTLASYTYYTSFLDMTISRTADGQRLFEGKAKARSRDDSLPYLVPNLVEALFTGFPGRSGEEVRISVPPPPKAG